MTAASPAGGTALPPGTGQHLTASTGAWQGGDQPADVRINLGPSHPSGHGLLRLRLTVDAGVISSAEPEIGFMHRGAEKLFEARDYRQIIVLANRHDWLGAFASELGVVLAAERLAGIEVPPRAVWARTLLAELNRVLSHLAFLSVYPPETVADTAGTGDRAARAAFAARETVQAVMEEISGGRMHYMFNRVGGLKEDLPAGWLGRASAAVAAVRRRLPQIEELIFDNEIFRARTVGVGVLTPDLVEQYGVSGPIARAAGVDTDLRRDQPYLAYADLIAAGGFRVPTRQAGDCESR
ncbi:MAG TPA: NADH-quinone oxidoreductase subunit D, partial [Streptosporangiaceae bacterium]